MTSIPPKASEIYITLEGDLLCLRLNGDYTLDIAQRVQEHIQRMSDEFGYRLSLIDVTRAGTITPEARRFLLKNRQRSKAPGAVAVVGAGFAVQTLAQMVMRALKVLTRSYLGVGFFAHESEARVWMDEQRQRILNDVRE